MKKTWSLDSIYLRFECQEFKNDTQVVITNTKILNNWLNNNLNDLINPIYKLEYFILEINKLYTLVAQLYNYSILKHRENATDNIAKSKVSQSESLLHNIYELENRFSKWIKKINDIELVINESDILVEHKKYIKEMATKKALGPIDNLIGKMQSTGSKAWHKLYQSTISTFFIPMLKDGNVENMSLGKIRSFAYSHDKVLRKSSFEAEIKAYEKIEDICAMCLHNIIGERITISTLKSSSPLEEALNDNQINSSILESMLNSIKGIKEDYENFFVRKAQLLGYTDGLPYYELYAPYGHNIKTYTFSEAQSIIIAAFDVHSKQLSNLARKAFNNNWIDAESRAYKAQSPYCMSIYAKKESRISINFSGTIQDVIILAHELGHAFHHQCLNNETFLNTTYSMIISETASIICETIVKEYLYDTLPQSDYLYILEKDISDSGFLIIDIYSRFLFENKLIELISNHSFNINSFKKISVEALKQAYGKGLDSNYLHPYLWISKHHYYKKSFYNFPYTFGFLLSKWLYNEFIKDISCFEDNLIRFLSLTGKYSVSDISKLISMQIDTTSFWERSMIPVRSNINKYMSLTLEN